MVQELGGCRGGTVTTESSLTTYSSPRLHTALSLTHTDTDTHTSVGGRGSELDFAKPDFFLSCSIWLLLHGCWTDRQSLLNPFSLLSFLLCLSGVLGDPPTGSCPLYSQGKDGDCGRKHLILCKQVMLLGSQMQVKAKKMDGWFQFLFGTRVR